MGVIYTVKEISMWNKLCDFIDEFLDYLMGFRKFIAFIGIFVVALVFRCKGMIDGGQMTDLLKSSFAVFCGANSVEHFTSMVKDHIASKIKLPDVLGEKKDG